MPVFFFLSLDRNLFKCASRLYIYWRIFLYFVVFKNISVYYFIDIILRLKNTGRSTEIELHSASTSCFIYSSDMRKHTQGAARNAYTVQ